MTLTRVPGVMRWTMVRSTWRIMCLGISPAGTSSGFSWSFKVCTSQNLDLSAIGTYGSRPQSVPPGAPMGAPFWSAAPFAAGSLLATVPFASHRRGGWAIPPKPGLRSMYLSDRHDRHWRHRRVALVLALAAAMTMPGMYTSLLTCALFSDLIDAGVSSETRCTWISSLSNMSLEPPTPVTSASFCGLSPASLRRDSSTVTAACSRQGM